MAVTVISGEAYRVDGMLIGYRFERTAQGDLHIHTRNLLQDAIAVLLGPIAIAAPVIFIVCVTINGGSPLVDVGPLNALLMVLGILLLAALGLVIMVYTGFRETLLLSRLEGEGRRRTRNFFGRRERVQAVFSIDTPNYLELRRHAQSKPIYTQLWLVMRDGTEHRLTTSSVPIVPGSKRTDLLLSHLADYLNVAVPTEVVIDSSSGSAGIDKPAPAPAKVSAGKSVKQRPGQEPASPLESTQKIGMPARAISALLGIFFAVLELTNVFQLVPSLFSGRLRVTGLRTRPTIYYWNEQPLAFSFHMLAGFVEVLIISVIAWTCLRIAIRGWIESNPLKR